MWGGLKDQSIVANQDESGLYQPTGRVFGTYGVAELGGQPVLNTSIPYDGDNYFPNNISGLGITTVVAESVPSHIRLKYELSVNGTAVYDQILSHSGLAVIMKQLGEVSATKRTSRIEVLMIKQLPLQTRLLEM